MQRAATRVASLAIRRFASSTSRPTAVASLLPATAALNAGTRWSLQPTAAAAAAALCAARRGYAVGARKTKAAVSDEEEEEEEEEDDEFEDMGSDEEFYTDFDDEGLDDSDSDDEEAPVNKRGRC